MGKMNINPTNNPSRFTIPQILLIIFIVLKLTKNIDWSWWWVISPVWIPLSLVLVLFLIGGFVLIITAVIQLLINKLK